MVKIIKEYREPTLGERFAEGISRGAKEFGAPHNRLTPQAPEKRPELHKTITDIASKTGIDYTPDNLLSINDQAHKYHKQGLDEFSSSVNALKDFKEGKLDREQIANQLSGQESSRKGFIGSKIDRLEEDLNRIKGKKPQNEQEKALRRAEADQRKIMAREQIAKNREHSQRRGGFHSLSSLSEEQLAKMHEPAQIKSEELAAAGRGAASELTFGLSEKLPFDKSLHQLSEEGLGKWVTAGRVVGSLGPAHLSFGAANALLKGTGAATRYGRQLVAAGAISGHQALTQKIETGTVRPGDIGLTFAGAATLGLAFEAAAPYVKSIANFFKRSTPKVSANVVPKNTELKPHQKAFKQWKEKSLLDASVKEAAEAGVNLEALAKGDAQEALKYQQVLQNLEKLPPSQLNEKISRAYSERELENLTRRSKVLQDQLVYSKRVKRIHQEIAEEEGRLAEKYLKETPKKDETKLARFNVSEEARLQLGEANIRLHEIRKAQGEAKDLISYMTKTKAPIEEIEKATLELQRLNVLNAEAEETASSLRYEYNKGKKYKLSEEIKNERENDLANFEHKVNTKPEEKVYSPDKREAIAKKISKRRELPGTSELKEDTHTRIIRERIKGYEDKVAQLNKKLKTVPDDQIPKVKKALDLAQKLEKQNRDFLRVHQRRRATKDLSNTLQRKEKLKGTNVKREDVSNAFKQAIKDPSESNVHKLQDAVYGPENSKIINDSMDSALNKAEKIFNGPGTEKEKVKLLKEALTEEKDAIGKASSNGEEAGKWSIKNNFAYKLGKWLFNKQNAKAKLFISGYIGYVLGIPTPRKLVNDMSDNRDAKRLANLSDSKASNYISDLRAKGLSAQRIKKIKAEADKLNRERQKNGHP